MAWRSDIDTVYGSLAVQELLQKALQVKEGISWTARVQIAREVAQKHTVSEEALATLFNDDFSGVDVDDAEEQEEIQDVILTEAKAFHEKAEMEWPVIAQKHNFLEADYSKLKEWCVLKNTTTED